MYIKQMYEDDRFNPAYNADINDLDEADKKKTLDKLFKLEDPNFVRCKKELVTEFTTKSGNIIKKRKNVYYDLYGSCDMGSHIRHAITGFRTQHIVGTKDEDLYFAVSDARGLTKTQNPLRLYFDSPEQYEKHCYTTVPECVKSVWHNKFMVAQQE